MECLSAVKPGGNAALKLCASQGHVEQLSARSLGSAWDGVAVADSKWAVAAAPKQVKPEGPHASPTPKYIFATTLKEQEEQLKSNALLQRFAESREALASDPYRPAHHFVSLESSLNDPNGLSFWQGRWHLFYQAYPPDEFPDLKDIGKRRQHWGHAVSDDLVHWRDPPCAIFPALRRWPFPGARSWKGTG